MSLDDELFVGKDERREIAFIREQLPNDLKDKFTDKQLLFVTDAIGTYLFESGILDSDDEEVDIDLEVISADVCRQAKEEKMGTFSPEDIYWVVQADLDFQEEDD